MRKAESSPTWMVNAFDYVTFIHMLTWDLPRKFWKKREIINFHNYWFLIWPSYFNLSEIIRKRTVFSANKFTEVRHRVHNYWIWILRHFDERQWTSCGTTVVPIVIWDYVHGELAVTFNEQTWPILKNLAWNTWARANCASRPRSGRGAQSTGEGVYLAWTRDRSR
jgi:hypothetical protein